MLAFDADTLGDDLYAKVLDYINQGLTLSDANKSGLIQEIKEKNEETGKLLEQILKDNESISFTAALKVAGEILENSTITENADKTFTWTYDGKTGVAKTREAANAEIRKLALAKNSDYTIPTAKDVKVTVASSGKIIGTTELNDSGEN